MVAWAGPGLRNRNGEQLGADQFFPLFFGGGGLAKRHELLPIGIPPAHDWMGSPRADILFAVADFGAVAHDAGFWDILHAELGDQSYIIKLYPRAVVLVAWALILVPVVFAAVKWPSFEAEMSPIAHDLTRGMFRLIHLVLLAFVALMFFDLKFSPNPQRMGLPGFMTFYYLAALCIGYYSGYVLLVFGRDVVYRWGQAKGLLRVVNKLMTGLLWMAAFALPMWLVCQNYPRVAALNGDAVSQYGDTLVRSLPPKSPTRQDLVLADDSIRLDLAEATAQWLGKRTNTSSSIAFLK